MSYMILSSFWHPIDSAQATLYSFLLFLDQAVYSFVDYAYQIFIFVSNGRIINDTDIAKIADRINIIIGLVMLFIVSFSLLKSLSNPDDLTKGDKSTAKLVTNILIVIIMLVLTPVAFRFAYQVQDTILKSRIITKIIVGTSSTDNNDTIKNAGFNMAIDVFSAFWSDTDETGTDTNQKYEVGGACEELSGKTIKLLDGSEIKIEENQKEYTIKEIGEIAKKCHSYSYYYQLTEPLSKGGTLQYYFIISTVAGVFMLYIMLSFCIDLGVRAAKLAFYQLVAPIPILSRIVPGKKDVYDKWFKATITTFLEVFIKLTIISFSVYLISLVPSIIGNIFSNESTGSTGVKTFGLVFLILGILMFAKQAPKLIGDLFGFDGSKMGLGIRKKLSEGLPDFAKGGAGAIGAGIGGASRNAYSAYKNRDKEQGLKKRFKNAANITKSGLGGLGGGAYRGYNASKSAKNLKELKAGINKGADETQTIHDERAEAGGFFRATGNSIQKGAKRTGQFFTGETASAKNKKAENLEKVSNASKEINTILDDSNNVKAVNAFYEQLKKERAASAIDYSKFHTDEEKATIKNFDTAIENASQTIDSNQRVLTENDTRISSSNGKIEKAKDEGKTAQVKLENLKSIPSEKRTKDQHQEFENAMQTIVNSNKTIETETKNIRSFEAEKETSRANISSAKEVITNIENNKKAEVERINSSHESEARTDRTREMVQLETDYSNAKNEARAEAATDKLKQKDVKFTAALNKLAESIDENQAVVTEAGITDTSDYIKKLENISKMEIPTPDLNDPNNPVNVDYENVVNSINEALKKSRDVTKKTGAKAFEYKSEAAKDEKNKS